MFVSRPFFDTSSEKAFELFISRFEKDRCSDRTPPWEMINTLAEFTNPKLIAIAPWTTAKLEQLHAALARTVKCANASWNARTAAINALKKTGADSKTFRRLLKATRRARGDENAAKITKKLESVAAQK